MKKKARKPSIAATEQHARFLKAAKQAEADESPDALDRAFKRLAPRVKKAAAQNS
jgi:hypothetical protein